MLNNQFNDISMMDTEKMARFPRCVRLVIDGTGEKVDVLVDNPVIIGRDDRGSTVDVDLTLKGGYRLGISRQHLRLSTAGANVYVTDLDSRNGSKLNEVDMQPLQSYTIQSGDKLELSGLVLHIHAIN